MPGTVFINYLRDLFNYLHIKKYIVFQFTFHHDFFFKYLKSKLTNTNADNDLFTFSD